MTSDKAQLLPDVKSGKQKTILLLLGAVALASVFLLPSLVSGPWLIDTTLEGPVVPDTSPDYVAPSTAAEKTKYRQDSQTVLAQIIQLRDLLQEQSVNIWAPVDFDLGLENVVRGDELYSYGEYRQALESYKKTLETFTELKQMGQDKLEASLESGFVAIESLNLVIATETSSLAIAIAPQDPRALELVKRTESLPGLTIQLETGGSGKSRRKAGFGSNRIPAGSKS